MKYALIMDYSGDAESWEQIRNDAENNKIKNVFIGTKEFVNVVRCIECKHWNQNGIGICKLHDIRPTPLMMDNWFCADGKVKKDD